jgi:hypothetical protein
MNPKIAERQYALGEKVQELVWHEASIRTLDRDLGKSGTQTAGGRTSKRWWPMSRWDKWAPGLPWKPPDFHARTWTGIGCWSCVPSSKLW